MSEYYNTTGIPSTSSPAASASIRTEFATIAVAFNKLPVLSGNAGKLIVVNASGNGMETLTTAGFADLLTNQTITGIKTFSTSPIIPTVALGDNSFKAASTQFVTAAIASVVSTNVLNAISTSIATEVTDRNAAIALEVVNRNSAIAANIATEVANRNTAIASSISTEVINRNLAVATEVTDRGSAIALEVTNRNLAIAASIATEATNRNTAISSNINTEATNRGTAIAVETTARSAAITLEVTNRNTAIAASIATEVTNRNTAIAAAQIPATSSLPYSSLTGVVPTWNQSTSGNAANISSYPLNQSVITTASPTFNNLTASLALSVGTTIYAGGNITAYSDERLKSNIAKIDNALEKVSSLSGYTFDRIDRVMPRQTGVIAQEVLAVLPEAVELSEDGIYSVAYGNIVGLLIEAIKELSKEIDTLKVNSSAL
jgi:hypothetical protein